MTRHPVPDEIVSRLAELLRTRVGLKCDGDSKSGLRLAVRARLEALGGVAPAAYLARLHSEPEVELKAILPLVTVGWTEFFRDATQFQALRQRILPDLAARAQRERRKLTIWSAGCATGEEPYSVAMLVAELGLATEDVEILATDVNPTAIERAREGRFGARRAAALPAGLLRRHFVPHGGQLQVSEDLRARVRFAAHNLASEEYPLPRWGKAWDLVLCRNVVIYFDGATTARVIRRFHACMAEGGLLCLGYSESLFRTQTDFELVEVGGAFVYRKVARGARGAGRAARASRARAASLAPPLAGARHLTEGARPSEAVPLAPRPGGSPRAQLEPERTRRAVVLLDQGRFEEAVRVLRQGLQEHPESLPLNLTLGNALLAMGQLDQARAAFQAALAAEPLCAEAHLFLGIALFEGGEEGAAEELRRALFLDPDLAVAHYYMARLAQGRGDLEDARRSYRNTIAGCAAQGRDLVGHFPDLLPSSEVLSRAARHALAALEGS